MANAEQLLNDAQYAFQSISAAETGNNDRNASRAKSLCKKIIRKYPASTEAVEAHALLKRLGVEAFTSNLAIAHRHKPHAKSHRSQEPPQPTPRMQQDSYTPGDETVQLDWSGLLSVILATPKTVLVVIAFIAFVVFGIFGVFIFVPLIAFVFLTGPFRQTMKPTQQSEMNKFVIRANAWIDKRLESGRGLA